MKKLKSIDVTVTYSVGLDDIDLPERVYDDLIALYESGVYEIDDGTKDEMELTLLEWLLDNIKEKDRYSASYAIEDFEEDDKQ